jgi:hypothetical protein
LQLPQHSLVGAVFLMLCSCTAVLTTITVLQTAMCCCLASEAHLISAVLLCTGMHSLPAITAGIYAQLCFYLQTLAVSWALVHAIL